MENTQQFEYKEDIFSQVVKAGKRTYYFDVKSTRENDYYITITESKKTFDSEGKSSFQKHKIFLYREDFANFIDSLQNTINFIKESKVELNKEIHSDNDMHSIEFEDLDNLKK